jgi:TRAP-type C4-dicarboxylate transport system permease small subunit
MDAGPRDAPAGPPGLARRVVEWWAVLGGVVMLGVALMTTWSAASGWLLGRPLPGDYELTEVLVAIAVFAFLPYCQLRRANIAVDTFTAWLPARANAVIDAFWDLVYAAAIGLLAWCLSNGAADMYRNGTSTMVLGLVVWPAIAAAMVLAWVLAATACVTAWRLMASARRP